jgi:hypothetical protein
MKRPFVFKITQQHKIIGKLALLLQCIIFPVVDALPPGYGQIYNIIFYDKQYDVTIGNFLGYSYVYFVIMLANCLGGHGAYV